MLIPAFGGFVPDLPLMMSGYGWKTPFGTLLPPGGQVAAFVRSTGYQNGDDEAIRSRLVGTLAAALPYARSGQQDMIVVLPGHTENVTDNTMLSGLVAGTKIIGVGRGANMPVFNWTNTAGSWLLNKADVVISGLRLKLDQANGVTKAINWSAADCLIGNCDIEVGATASLKAAIAIEVNTGGDRGEFVNNIVRGLVAGAVTNGLLFTGVVDAFRVYGSEFKFASTTTNGNINIPGAVTDINISYCNLHNSVAASTTTIAIADVASSGVISYCNSAIENAAAGATKGIIFAAATTTSIKTFQCFTGADKGKSGILSPAVTS